MTPASTEEQRERIAKDLRTCKILIAVIAVIMILGLVGLYFVGRDQATNAQVEEAAARAKATCEVQVKGRLALRDVIRQSFSQGTFEFPSDPSVDPAVIEYLNKIVAAGNGNTQQREKEVLDKVPEVKCVNGVITPIKNS